MSCQEEGRTEKKRKEMEKKFIQLIKFLLLFAPVYWMKFLETQFSTMMRWMIPVPVSDSNANHQS